MPTAKMAGLMAAAIVSDTVMFKSPTCTKRDMDMAHRLARIANVSLEDLGKGLRSQVGTMFGTKAKGPRYLEMAEGYVTRIALNKDDEIIGYEFVNLGKMMDAIKKGTDANEALDKAKGHYGQFDGAAKYIDPRHE